MGKKHFSSVGRVVVKTVRERKDAMIDILEDLSPKLEGLYDETSECSLADALQYLEDLIGSLTE